MIRSPLPLMVACVIGGSLVHAWQEPRFRSGTDTVSVYATVLDRDGHLVTDLTRDDFVVLDDGKAQPLSLFASDLQPITVVVMLDRSGSIREKFGLVRDAAEEFVHHLLPDDRARIGSFSVGVEIDPVTFTSDRQELVRILRENLQDQGPTPLWNATAAAMDALAGEEGRRVVLLFTDGKDTPDPGRNVTFDQVRARTEVEDVMVYAIGLGSERCVSLESSGSRGGILFEQQPGGRTGRRRPLPGGPVRPPGLPRILPPLGGTPPWRPPSVPSPETDRACFRTEPDPHLRALSEIGGGGYFELDDADNLRATFTRVADELHRQYALAYPVPVADGKPHRIEVRLRRPGMTVRARRGYVAPAP